MIIRDGTARGQRMIGLDIVATLRKVGVLLYRNMAQTLLVAARIFARQTAVFCPVRIRQGGKIGGWSGKMFRH